MKRNISYCILIVLIAMGSCSKRATEVDVSSPVPTLNGVVLSSNEFTSISFDGNTELPSSEIKKIVNEFIEKSKSTTKSADSYVITIKHDTIVKLKIPVTKTKSINTNYDLGQVKFSTVEIVNTIDQDKKGYSVVCSDARYPNVLSFVENGKIDEADNNGSLLLIKNAENIAVSEINKINNLRDSLREKTILKVCNALGIAPKDFSVDKVLDKIYVPNPPVVGSTVKAVPVQNPGGTLLAQTGPFTQVNWDQTWPMNEYILPLPPAGSTYEASVGADSWIYNGRYPIGCVPVAMAHIASYYKPTMFSQNLGRNINWTTALSVTDFPFFQWTFGAPSNSVSQEVASIMKTIASGSSTTYSEDGGSTNSQTARNYMQTIGIYMDNPTTCTWINIAPSLNALRLVYATGSARSLKSSGGFRSHAWVIDGSQIRQRNTMAMTSSVTLKSVQPMLYNCYIHCNVGWGGTANGWYLTNTDGSVSFEFEPGNAIWDLDLKVYPNVRKQ